MKSKQAHEFIRKHLNDALINSRWQQAIGPRNAYKAIEIAEDYAKETAIEALKKTCIRRFLIDGDPKAHCKCAKLECDGDCELVVDFLKIYDDNRM